MEQRFLYSVYPKRVIKSIPGTVIRTAKSLYLNKEEVLICLKNGSVYRRFANESRNEKVTILNIDRLHNAKFMTEEEYEAFLQANIDSKRGSVIGELEEVTETETESVEETKPVNYNNKGNDKNYGGKNKRHH